MEDTDLGWKQIMWALQLPQAIALWVLQDHKTGEQKENHKAGRRTESKPDRFPKWGYVTDCRERSVLEFAKQSAREERNEQREI